jgi:hypothetical protein
MAITSCWCRPRGKPAAARRAAVSNTRHTCSSRGRRQGFAWQDEMNKEKEMLEREPYIPGPASAAQVRGRRQVDAHSGQRTAPLAGKSLAGAHRSGAAARVGALRRRWEPGYGRSHSKSHLGGSAHADRNKVTRADAPRMLEYGDIRWELEALGERHTPDAVAQHQSPLHFVGRRGLAHFFRRSGAPSRWNSHRPSRRRRSHETRRLAAIDRRVRPAVRH